MIGPLGSVQGSGNISSGCPGTDYFPFSRVLAELFGIYVTLGTAKQQYEPLFEDLRRLLDASGDPIKETAIVTMGLLGKYGLYAVRNVLQLMLSPFRRILSRDILGKVVFLLITQLASQNPVIKGSAYMQESSAPLSLPPAHLPVWLLAHGHCEASQTNTVRFSIPVFA